VFHLASLADIDREIAEYQQSITPSTERIGTASPEVSVGLKQLVRKRRTLEIRIREMESHKNAGKRGGLAFGTSKLKTWIKRILTLGQPTKLEIVRDIDEDGCAVGREVKGLKSISTSPSDMIDLGIDGALHTSHIVLNAARRDLLIIGQSLSSVG
jgi:hypothetical protein